jgi:hypothetical protein
MANLGQFGQPQPDENKELKVGDKVRWKQMPAAIAAITQANYGTYTIKFEADGPLKGTSMPMVPRKQLWEVTVLDELAIEGTETADPFFRKKRPVVAETFEDKAREFIENERKQKDQ